MRGAIAVNPKSVSDPVIRVAGLTTRFGTASIHEGLDLEVWRGEILGLVGGSGTGKTVLLRQMMLLQAPTAGRIEILGMDATTLDRHSLRRFRRRMGVLFQHGALFTGLTVRQNISMVIREHARLDLGLCNAIAELKIALSGLPASAAEKYPDALSGGMIKRAALARALALDPELLFLDEPTSGLDPVSTNAFDELIVKLRDLLGLTVIMITHDPESLRRATDRIAFLANRRVWALGSMPQLMASEEPLTRAYFQGAQLAQPEG
ncbi:ATP-binding cassette domain-containing protein [Aquisalimonas sp.]|uniref:ABC transporter ATP-binding protein n=1 Tax=Aquisalimonas sp. TaxID=1872621 RepID=UPI0025BD0F21|nr:ATP-binding cassette domain-containing protein [Aquisalimonas sp.]